MRSSCLDRIERTPPSVLSWEISMSLLIKFIGSGRQCDEATPNLTRQWKCRSGDNQYMASDGRMNRGHWRTPNRTQSGPAPVAAKVYAMTERSRPYRALGAKLRAERKARHWTQLQLAGQLHKALGENYPAVSSLAREIRRWEDGAHPPNARWQRAYALAFGVPDSDLFGIYAKAEPIAALIAVPSLSVDPGTLQRLANLTADQTDALLINLLEQWHVLVKTDNLLGPRHALGGVTGQLELITGLLRTARQPVRNRVLEVGAQYAESAAWLYEDAGVLTAAHGWTSQAMEWAIEADNQMMISWTLFRRSQQAKFEGTPVSVIGLATAARRGEEKLPPRMRAALLQQEAQGHALDGAEARAQNLIDDAHTFAASDDPGDASGGHGGFCTPAYLEMMRGTCWLSLGKPARAADCFKTALTGIPEVYRRDHGVAQAGLAAAFARLDQPEKAARAAIDALVIAQSAGSTRIMDMVESINARLARRRHLEAVSELAELVAEVPAI
jgi:transcriptional regulator with XRE-family HTH domain